MSVLVAINRSPANMYTHREDGVRAARMLTFMPFTLSLMWLIPMQETASRSNKVLT
jgi:hypothetical protein